jgi:hypothetical protein
MHGFVATPDAAEQERRQSLYGHLEHKEVGSPEWCWQMLEKLKNLWNRKSRSAEELQRTMDELFPSKPWLVIPSQEPYGTSEAMLKANGIDPDEFIERVQTIRERVQQAETGDSLPSGGDYTSEEGKQRALGNLPNAQTTRAERNGISRKTQQKLDRLARDHPDLHEQVQEGELSVNRAAILAGFTQPTMTVPKEDIPALARALRNRLTDDQIVELIDHLKGAA